MACNESQDSKWKQEAELLRAQLDYYEQENARLQQQNEALHETAWELIHRLRTLEGKN